MFLVMLIMIRRLKRDRQLLIPSIGHFVRHRGLDIRWSLFYIPSNWHRRFQLDCRCCCCCCFCFDLLLPLNKSSFAVLLQLSLSVIPIGHNRWIAIKWILFWPLVKTLRWSGMQKMDGLFKYFRALVSYGRLCKYGEEWYGRYGKAATQIWLLNYIPLYLNETKSNMWSMERNSGSNSVEVEEWTNSSSCRWRVEKKILLEEWMLWLRNVENLYIIGKET